MANITGWGRSTWGDGAWGEATPDEKRCNLQFPGKTEKIELVGSYRLGISDFCKCFDMCGNVWEWCLDPCGAASDDPSNLRLHDPTHRRWLMGGAFNTPAWHSIAQYKLPSAPDVKSAAFGFRIVRAPEESLDGLR